MRLATGTYFYSVEDHDRDERYLLNAPASVSGVELQTFATLCGEDYHHAHDGWEASWPLTFAIYDGDQLLGRFIVEREVVPQFSAASMGGNDQ